MGQIYRFLGSTVGLIQSNMTEEERRKAYACDVVYVTNSELGFDYLGDPLALSGAQTVLPGGAGKFDGFCVVDEADSVLIDEARTPLIISKQVPAPANKYTTANTLVEALKQNAHYSVDFKNKACTLNEIGYRDCKRALGIDSLFFIQSDGEAWTLFIVNAINTKERFDGHQKVLAPSGRISRGGKVEISDQWNAHCGYYIYDVHRRFGNLIATNHEGRLHLAGLYASSSSYMAEPRLSNPGTAVATELVRQCWTNEPLSARVQMQLIEVSKLSNLSCTLRLMCSWIWQSSNSARFLHTEEPQPTVESLDPDVLAVDEYAQNQYTPRLLPYEELILLGRVHPHTTTLPLEGYKEQPMAYYDHVLKTDGSLLKEYIRKKRKKANMSFPLQKKGLTKGLEEQVSDDLIHSWEGYCELPTKVAFLTENA
jgi:hypothetical protein